jgi:hypothetical protein
LEGVDGVIVLSIYGEDEAKKFLTYLLLNYKEPIMAYRGAGAGEGQGLLILMSVGQDIMLVSVNDEPAECRESDYYALSEFTRLTCGKGIPSKDVIINCSIMFVLRNYELLIDNSGKIQEASSRGVDFKEHN